MGIRYLERTKKITYPDGEEVSYSYDNSGKLVGMNGIKGIDTYFYVKDIAYDKYERRTKIEYGNETRNEYYYNDITQQMTNLRTYDANSSLLQNLTYQYDDVGNIYRIDNLASANGVLGGIYQHNYEYDSLYRLVDANGYAFDYLNTVHNFSTSLTYNLSPLLVKKIIFSGYI